jgi:hypothetical protein
MSQAVTKVKIPVRVRIWKSRRNYIAVVIDEATKKALEPYIDRRVTIEINGMAIDGKLVKIIQKSTYYVGMFLPRRLTPTWEKLRQKAKEHDATIVITEEGGLGSGT